MSSFYLDSIVDAHKRLNDPRNLLNETKIGTIGQGKNSFRGTGERKEQVRLSPESKGLVAALATISGNKKRTAKEFGLGANQVTRWANGKTTDGINPDPEVKKERDSILDSIRGKASNVVLQGLDQLLNPGRIAEAKTTEIATIAGIAMSIVEKTEKKSGTFIAGNVVFMTPPVRRVDDYLELEVVPVRD